MAILQPTEGLFFSKHSGHPVRNFGEQKSAGALFGSQDVASTPWQVSGLLAQPANGRRKKSNAQKMNSPQLIKGKPLFHS
ncbi:hypothetical protein TWF173_007686 [Orbilia oligospora]|nr:hypothetical protein TWF173_007686 [Orbilia oligospora]